MNPDELELRLGVLPYAEEYTVFAYKKAGLEIPAIALLEHNGFFRDNNICKEQDYVEEDIRKRTVCWPEAERIRKVIMIDDPLPRSTSGKVRRFEVSDIYSADADEQRKLTTIKAEVEKARMQKHIENSELAEIFTREVAEFLNIDPEKLKLKSRLDTFMQLDSLGVIAMLIKLEQRFKVSFKELIGSSIETFEELYEFFATNIDFKEKKLLKQPVVEAGNADSMPPLLDFSSKAIEKRQEFVREQLNVDSFELPKPENPAEFNGNIEGFSGFVQLPVGICGPLKVLGNHAQGEFYVPMATTEGALVSSISRGCQIITMSDGAQVRVVDEGVLRTPAFVLSNLEQMERFGKWINENLLKIAEAAESTTRYGKLKSIEPFPIANNMILRFNFATGDASGQNMITIATREAISYILSNYDGKIEEWFLESNLSGDKKINAVNFTRCRGRKLIAQCRIPASVVIGILHTTPQKICRLAHITMLTSIQAHSFGMQAHYANTLAAVYIAAGQDPACVAESSAGITSFEMIDDDLLASVTLPGIMVGTVGGGTRLPTQNSCLKLMGCSGAGKANKFAEILACAVLAGEISITGAMASDEFTQAHAKYGRSDGFAKH